MWLHAQLVFERQCHILLRKLGTVFGPVCQQKKTMETPFEISVSQAAIQNLGVF